jgi:hypothetical protein
MTKIFVTYAVYGVNKLYKLYDCPINKYRLGSNQTQAGQTAVSL